MPRSVPSGAVTNTGPVSRSHRSSTGTRTTSTVSPPQARCASAASSGEASRTTGSYSPIVRATAATFARTAGVSRPQAESAGGQPMNVRVWGRDSSGRWFMGPACQRPPVYSSRLGVPGFRSVTASLVDWETSQLMTTDDVAAGFWAL